MKDKVIYSFGLVMLFVILMMNYQNNKILFFQTQKLTENHDEIVKLKEKIQEQKVRINLHKIAREEQEERIKIHKKARSSPPLIERIYSNIATEIKYQNPVVFAGDSMIHRQNWNWLFRGITVENKEKEPPVIFNRGIGGNTSNDLVRRYQNNILDMNPSAIFVEIGTNDLRYVEKNNKEQIIGNLLNNYDEIIKMTMERKDSMLYIISILPVPGRDAGIRNSAAVEVNSRLKDMANKYKRTVFIDCFNDFYNKEKKVILKKYSLSPPKTAHLNSKGYELWGKILLPYLQEFSALKL